MAVKAVIMDRRDDVATLLAGVSTGEAINVYLRDQEVKSITAMESIKFGHKVAIVGMKRGQVVKKYGEPIGRLSENVDIGHHVHVHNMVSSSAGQRT